MTLKLYFLLSRSKVSAIWTDGQTQGHDLVDLELVKNPEYSMFFDILLST